MRRLLLLLPVGLALAACGGSSRHAATTTTVPSPATAVGAGAHTLYRGGGWAVVQRGATATVLRLRSGSWRRSAGGVRIQILGPRPGATVGAIPQVAVQLLSKTALVESALWVDGKELLEKGGGSPTRGTIYGAPETKLTAGRHVAVAYGRTAAGGTAVAWTFTVG